MLYRRHGLPEEGEIVLCKVTTLFPNSVFVNLLEFQQSGMIHISEVSPGRIRNLRDFVSVGRQIVCKVLRVDRERGHIDLSLRRVNSTERVAKLDQLKQELKAESLVMNLAKKLKRPLDKFYSEIASSVLKEYSHLHLCFWDVVSGEVDLKKLGLEKGLADELAAAVMEKFKPEKIAIKGEIRLKTYDSNGLQKIKSALLLIEHVSPTISVTYLGAGRYKLAEKHVLQVEAILEKFNDKLSTAVLEREKES